MYDLPLKSTLFKLKQTLACWSNNYSYNMTNDLHAYIYTYKTIYLQNKIQHFVQGRQEAGNANSVIVKEDAPVHEGGWVKAIVLRLQRQHGLQAKTFIDTPNNQEIRVLARMWFSIGLCND